MPDYLKAVRKKLEKQGVPEEEIEAQLKDLAVAEKAKKLSVGGVRPSGESDDLRKIILKQGQDIHDWKIKYRELEQEFNELKEQGGNETQLNAEIIELKGLNKALEAEVEEWKKKCEELLSTNEEVIDPPQE